MAHFLEQYIHMINSCDDYDSLSSAVNTCISKNVMNHIIVDLKNKIDSLELNTSYSNFVKSLVWASTVSEYDESSLNILRYFCNKAVSEFDSLISSPDDFTLMVFAICADDKSFISKLSDEKKNILINTIVKWYLVITVADDTDQSLLEQLRISVDLILQGKTMEELDRYFEKKYAIDMLPSQNGEHKVNEVLRPFQALFINIIQNIDQVTLLHQLNINDWQNLVAERTREIVLRYTKKAKDESLYSPYYLFIHDIMVGFDMLNRKLTSTGYSNMANPVVGEFLLGFLNVLHEKYEYDNFDTKEISLLLQDAKNLYLNNFAVDDSTRTIINCIVSSYCNTGDFEDSFLKGDYFDGIKAYLRNSELFKAWLDTIEDNKYKSLPDRVYATYVHHFLNPQLELAEKLIAAQEQSLEIATEAIKNKKKVSNIDEEKDNRDSDNGDENNDNSPNDEQEQDQDEPNEEEDEVPEEYDGPEIDAKQSNKGYKKSSKVQADGERKIYKAYKKYKDNEEKVDSQLSKMLSSAKRAFTQDKTEEIIEGKKFTPIRLLKKVLMTAAIFNVNKVAGFIYLLTSHTISKKRTAKQKKEILLQIDLELKMMDEKIEDAKGDGNRKAKYALMRTKAELERARDKIKYNLTATKEDMRVAKTYVNNPYKDNV